MKKIFSFLVFFIFLSSAQAAQIMDNPALMVTLLDGKKFDLKEKLGKVVIVNFWAVWCIDCRKEIPLLEELYRDHNAQGLEIIGVSIDKKADQKKVSDIAAKLPYPNAMFEDVAKSDFKKPKAIPLNYVIDKKGKVIATLSGDGRALSKKDFEDVIKPLLKN
jgi:thiol-disulfide isomerase/thioredoxin